MSALTDLFTAFANKIRSKTGGSATYTPPQMVNAIDDVYDAGVAAGTPTLTGDATASDVMSGKTFYNNSTTKQTGSYVPPTITSITPSNSSPVSMTANNNYKPSANGYAISSYDSVTPSSSGIYFSSGIKKMASSGYAYSSQQSLYNLAKAATVKNGGTGSATQSFTAVVNRRYLVIAVRFSSSGTASNAGISSGATVDTQFINNQSSYSGQGKLWAAIVKATATTVIMQGSNVVCCYMPLDD